MSRARPTPRPKARARGAVRAVGAFAALVVALFTAFGGLGYVWCAPMQRAMLKSCCPAAARRDHAEGQRTIEQPCCESLRLGMLPVFDPSVPDVPWIAPAPLVMVLCLAWLFAVGGLPPPSRAWLRARRTRAGPSPPIYLLVQSWLC